LLALNLQIPPNKAEKDLKNIRSAFYSRDIDVKQPLFPAEDNELPLEMLGTKTADGYFVNRAAYILAYPLDPFAKRWSEEKRGYRFITHPLGGRSYGCGIFVSRGPDRDWDIDRLPLNSEVYKIAPVPNDAQSIMRFPERDQMDSPHYWPKDGRYTYYMSGSGEKIYGETYKVRALPDGENPKYPTDLTREEVVNYLNKHNVSIYDPTNGIWSDGDIVIFYNIERDKD
jgi:hypothetical protein